MDPIHSTSRERRFLILYSFLIFIFLVVADQLTKYYIVAITKSLYSNPRSLLPGFLNIVTVRNSGAAWGLFRDNNLILLAVALIALLFFAIFFKSLTEWYRERVIAFFMIISGIIGNSIDRIFRGSVVDFLDFYIKSYHWPAFNVADSAICVGVFLIAISIIFRAPKKSDVKN